MSPVSRNILRHFVHGRVVGDMGSNKYDVISEDRKLNNLFSSWSFISRVICMDQNVERKQ